jgi:FkbM family methyltransferase
VARRRDSLGRVREALISPARRIVHGSRRFVDARRHEWRVRRLAGRRLLRAFAEAYPNARFIEIGANDGDHSDHLRPYLRRPGWRGVMVEPQPNAFARLRANYNDRDGIELENAAIGDRDGRLPFYEIDPPGSVDLLGSLSRDALLAHGLWIHGIEGRIVRTEVPAMRFESLCRKHRLERIDLLALDTEGYDYEILKQIDFDRHRPRLVVYEHSLLMPADREGARRLLRRHGYELMEEYYDTWCLDVGRDDELTDLWRRLEPRTAAISLRPAAGPG